MLLDPLDHNLPQLLLGDIELLDNHRCSIVPAKVDLEIAAAGSWRLGRDMRRRRRAGGGPPTGAIRESPLQRRRSSSGRQTPGRHLFTLAWNLWHREGICLSRARFRRRIGVRGMLAAGQPMMPALHRRLGAGFWGIRVVVVGGIAIDVLRRRWTCVDSRGHGNDHGLAKAA